MKGCRCCCLIASLASSWCPIKCPGTTILWVSTVMTDWVYTHLLKHISPFWGDKFNPFLMTICLFQVFVMTPIWNTNCSCLTRKSFITRFIGLLTSSILHRCKRVRSTTPTVRTCTVSPTDLWCYCWRLSGHLRGLHLQIGCALSFKTLSRCLLGSTVSSTCFKILYNASLFFGMVICVDAQYLKCIFVWQ